MAAPMMHETVWFDSYKAADAERIYQETMAQDHKGLSVEGTSSLVNEIQKTRQFIKNSLNSPHGTGLAVGVGIDTSELCGRVERLECENKDLRSLIVKLESRVAALEVKSGSPSAPAPKAAPVAAVAPAAAAPAKKADDDDSDSDFNFSDSDDDDAEERERIKQERVAAYNAKKSKKPALIAKSTIVLDVKPWDDETDLGVMEKNVRSIEMDGLLWGGAKLVEVGYGIKKLQIGCVVEDLKVGTDDLEEKITAFEDLVQSVDIVAFNKV